MSNSIPCASAPTTCTSTDLFTSTVKLIAASQCCFTDDFTSDQVKDKDNFHFIIVGGGTAGNVVANRLSEVEGWNVLLLEAGLKAPTVASVPRLNNYLFNTSYDWNYKTENNNRTSQALKNGEVLWHRGKMLGGSGAINGMLYVRGRRPDYQTWYNLGNPSWNAASMFSFAKKAESLQNSQLKSIPTIRDFYGENGPQPLNRINSTHRPLTIQVLNSLNSMGIRRVIDTNVAVFQAPGLCGITPVTAANGMRYGTDKSYIFPVRKRGNLKVVTGAFVIKILLNKNKKAYGVEVIINGTKMQLFVKYEVIVSAGAINSPQLLMVSGIGPKSHLESLNISCKVDLQAVGKNLQDHLRVLLPIFGDKSAFDNRNEKKCSVETYCYNRTGYLAEGNLDDILAFYTLNPNNNYPEFQNHFTFIFENASSYIEGLGFRDSVKDSIVASNENKTLYAIYVTLLHPRYRGSILLKTSNPRDKPIIDANYFGDNRDLVLTAKGIKFILKILNTEFFKFIHAFIQQIKLPECDKFVFNTLRYWECYAKNLVSTIYHPAGTCKMGPNPRDSVVNNYLMVHGVKDLRIIDASVMPELPSGNINGPTIAVGEMGADMIKRSHQNTTT